MTVKLVKVNFNIHDHGFPETFGVFKGYVQEAINEVSLLVIYAAYRGDPLPQEQLESLVGKSATLKITRDVVEGTGDVDHGVSRYDGVVYEVHQPNPFLDSTKKLIYKFVIRPKVWTLNFSARAASWPNTSRTKVIDDVFKEYELQKDVFYQTKYTTQTQKLPQLNQILQCELSDWDFVQRVMMEAGINYHFFAPKDGSGAEMMILSDDRGFFKQELKSPIKWIQADNQNTEPLITSFETRVRSVPKLVKATSSLGDGRTDTFVHSVPVEKGQGGTFNIFSVEGDDQKIADRMAEKAAEEFDANRVAFEGRSTHHLIRTGEIIEIKNAKMDFNEKVLVTSVKHFFEMGYDQALSGEKRVDYYNEFTAAKMGAQIRPARYLRMIDSEQGNLNPVRDPLFGIENKKDMRAVLQKQSMDLLNFRDQRSRQYGDMGVMIGIVEDEETVVSPGKEMTCRISNERFPDGLIAKVSTAWLVQGGGITALPRKGMQVYFVIVQGNGGENEAVIIGYRPTKDVPGQDPALSSNITRTVEGETEDEVVKAEKIAPNHRQRVGIRGENATSEVTLLDDEGSVSVHANTDVILVSDARTRMYSSDYIHLSGSVAEQFASVNRLITTDKNERIVGKDHLKVEKGQSVAVSQSQQTTVGGNIEVHSTEGDIHVMTDDEAKSISLDNGEENRLGLMEGKQAVLACGDDEVFQLDKGEMASMKSGTQATIAVGKNTINIVSDTIEIKMGSNSITIANDGITIDSAVNVKVTAAAKVSVEAAQISMAGAMVEIN